MGWSTRFGADNQPDKQQINDFIQSSLWEELNQYLGKAYMTEPVCNYSSCSMQPGWNVKYTKSGKSLCTLYPMEGYFIALVVIGRKEMTEAEFLCPSLSEYVQMIFQKTEAGQGAKWLMIDVKAKETVQDITKLIALRVKPKIKAEL